MIVSEYDMTWKGGDFMESLVPQGRVPDERKSPTHPLVRGKTRFDTALELARTTDPDRPIDWSIFRSVTSMDAGGE